MHNKGIPIETTTEILRRSKFDTPHIGRHRHPKAILQAFCAPRIALAWTTHLRLVRRHPGGDHLAIGSERGCGDSRQQRVESALRQGVLVQ